MVEIENIKHVLRHPIILREMFFFNKFCVKLCKLSFCIKLCKFCLYCYICISAESNNVNPHQTGVSESLIRGGGPNGPPLDIDQMMDFANSVFTGA